MGFDGREIIDTVTVSYTASDNNASVSEGTVTLAANAVTTYILEGLQPLTEYVITVITTNQFESSLPTMITETTEPLCKFMIRLIHYFESTCSST